MRYAFSIGFLETSTAADAENALTPDPAGTTLSGERHGNTGLVVPPALGTETVSSHPRGSDCRLICAVVVFHGLTAALFSPSRHFNSCFS